jgi:protein SCO1
MMNPNLSRRAALMAAMFGSSAVAIAGEETKARPQRTKLPNLVVRDHTGKEFRFNDDLIAGRCVVMNFMYVKCQGICPDMTTKIKQAYDYLAGADILGKKVWFYTFSLNEDAPEELAAYRQRHEVEVPGWSFFTGSRDAIKQIRWSVGFANPTEEEDADLDAHTGMVRFGNVPLDRWSSCPALGNPKDIARSVVSLFPPNERPVVKELQFTPTRNPAQRS